MRLSLPLRLAAACLVAAASLRTSVHAATPAKVEFNRDVRPILSENCYSCHGPDKGQRKAQLRLDERESTLKHGAVVPGEPDESELVLRILSEDDDVMPPAEAHKTLTDAQKQTLREWISQGAEYQPHWAYVAPVRRELPQVRRQEWVRNPVDAFLLASLEARGHEPSPEAPKARLIRRLYLDLLGLPPSPAEVRDFVADEDAGAYDKLVDRLLESPHYGERMAVGWLDLARFTDTVGYHGDQGQRVFPYRDYVVDSFNGNKPFDVFATEQLAGDLLPDPTAEELVATGFNRLNMMTREGGAQPEEYLAKYAADRVRTVGLTFLGSTLGCAECHDHKYDPFTQRDFYTLSAFFADVKQWGVYNDYDYTPNPELKGWSNDHPFPPEVEVESPYLKERRRGLVERLRAVAAAPPEDQSAFTNWTEAARNFLDISEGGWATLAADTPDGVGDALSDGSVLVTKTGPKDRKEKEGAIRFQLPASDSSRWISRIRVELLPDEKHEGRITRDGSEQAVVALSATVHSAGEAPKRPLAYHLADADFKALRYFNGDEVPGILAGWRSAKERATNRQVAVWCLETPVELASSDALEVVVKSPQAGRVRVSVSPFGVSDEGDPLVGLGEAERRSLTSAHPTPDDLAVVRGLYHRAAGRDSKTWALVRETAKAIQACRGGRAHSLVTLSAPPRETRVLPRGDWQNRTGEVVEPEVPAFLPHESVPTGRRATRLDLARWITSPENPLTARVFMNRLWRQVFGVGISGVVEDVGAQGEWPVHPELLDWLAVEFRESGWDVKRMVKLLVTSAAYRQDSRARPELKDIDPGNRWVAFLSPRRLEAEFVRDNALAAAGLLNLDLGGPSAFPYQPAGYYSNLQFPNRDYIASEGELQYRRGLYSHWQRTFLHPMLANFDAPSREECTPTRNAANTPQQALTLLNDPTFVEAARSLAAAVLAEEGPTSDEERLDRAFERALGRPADREEADALLGFLAERREGFEADPGSAEELLGVGAAPIPGVPSPGELASWTLTCRVVLNLHETITRY